MNNCSYVFTGHWAVISLSWNHAFHKHNQDCKTPHTAKTLDSTNGRVLFFSQNIDLIMDCCYNCDTRQATQSDRKAARLFLQDR